MLVYAVVSAYTESAVELSSAARTPNACSRMRSDEPDWANVLSAEPLELPFRGN